MEWIVHSYLRPNSVALVADYGCGNMPYRPMIETSQTKYMGYDFESNTDADGYLTPTCGLPLADGEADALLSTQVLEHVVDPLGYLAEAHRVLKKDGFLVLSTHGAWKYHPDPTDFWRWTCDGLQKIVSDSGFEVQEFVGVLGVPATSVQLLQDYFQSYVPGRLQPLFFRVCQFVIRVFDARFCSDDKRNKDACVFIVVATKA